LGTPQKNKTSISDKKKDQAFPFILSWSWNHTLIQQKEPTQIQGQRKKKHDNTHRSYLAFVAFFFFIFFLFL